MNRELREVFLLWAAGFESIALGFRKAADLALLDQMPDETTRAAHDAHQAMIIALWNRLGEGNQAMLAQLADAFNPSEPFTLATALDVTDETEIASLRGRLMNIGRSLKSLGFDSSILWEITWADDANEYRWTPEAHSTIKTIAGTP